jgi:hypothetical protein
VVVQFVHLPLLLFQIFEWYEEFTLLSAVLLALRELFVAGVVGFPLSLLVLLDIGISSGLLLFDRFLTETESSLSCGSRSHSEAVQHASASVRGASAPTEANSAKKRSVWR